MDAWAWITLVWLIGIGVAIAAFGLDYTSRQEKQDGCRPHEWKKTNGLFCVKCEKRGS